MGSALNMQNITQWFYSLDVRWDKWLMAALVFVFFLVLRKLFTKYIFRFVLNLSGKSKSDLKGHIVSAFERPVRILLILIGIYLALQVLGAPPQYQTNLVKIFRSLLILLIAWGFFQLTGATSQWADQVKKKFNFEMDSIVIPFLSKVVRFVIVALAISIIAQEWGYPISGFVAGLGLGGLAVAMAAKDVLANIFGGIVIIWEKPFSIGEWIQTPSVEGIVEDITFRSTRVRTFAEALVTVPNSTLVNEPITNWSRMGKRRITFHLRIKLNTPREKLEACVQKIRNMLENHPEIHKETLFVHFDQFSTNSLDIFLYFFTITTNWGKWLRVKEECNFKIMEILEQEGVYLALPITEVFFDTPLKKKIAENNASSE